MEILALMQDDSVRSVPLDASTKRQLGDEFKKWEHSFLSGKREIAYHGAYRPEDDEVLRVSDYELPKALKACAKSLPTTTQTLTSKILESAPPKALIGVSVGASPVFRFQSVTARNIMKAGHALFFKATFKANKDPILSVSRDIHAIHASGKLLFKSEHTVRHFLDLDLLFREATDEEIEKLFDGRTFSVGDMSAVKALSNTVLRRKLQHVLEGVKKGRTFDGQELKRVAKKDLRLDLVVHKGTVTVPTEPGEFRKFVQLLADDYVESLVGGAKYVTSSKRPLLR